MRRLYLDPPGAGTGLCDPRAHPTPQGRREARTDTRLPRTQATGPTGLEVPPGAGQAQLAVSVGTVPRPCQSHLGQPIDSGAATNACAAEHAGL